MDIIILSIAPPPILCLYICNEYNICHESKISVSIVTVEDTHVVPRYQEVTVVDTHAQI